MKKLSFILLAGLSMSVQAANYLTFDQNGAMTQTEIREGFGSKRMGFDLAGLERVSVDCQEQGDALACSFGAELNPLAGTTAKSQFEGRTINIEHRDRGIIFRWKKV